MATSKTSTACSKPNHRDYYDYTEYKIKCKTCMEEALTKPLQCRVQQLEGENEHLKNELTTLRRELKKFKAAVSEVLCSEDW